jgi:hypothetical protein
MIHGDALEAVKRLYGFDSWAGANALPHGLFVQNYRFGEPVPGWQLLSATEVPALGGYPAMVQTTWRVASIAGESLVRVDIYECLSRMASHEFFLKLLGEVQVAVTEKVRSGGVGDVSYVAANSELAIFARANLVIFVSRAGSSRTPVVGAASSLDSDIVQEPKITIETAKAFAAVHEELVTGKVGEPVPLALPQAISAMKLAPGEAKPPTVKVFSDGGEATMESGALQFIPTRPGIASVRLYTIEQGSGAIAQRKVAMKVEK